MLRVTDNGAVATSPLEITVQDDPAFPNIVSPDTVTIAPGQDFTYKIDAPVAAESTTDETTYKLVGDLPSRAELRSEDRRDFRQVMAAIRHVTASRERRTRSPAA